MNAILKNPRLENPHLLELARIVPRPCLLAVPGYCVSGEFNMHREVSCCACHGNGAEWNKGGRIKAHDFFSVWGCHRCHQWLDTSSVATGEIRDQYFRQALERQIVAWNELAKNFSTRPRDAASLRWALCELFERGYCTMDALGNFIPYLPRIHAQE